MAAALALPLAPSALPNSSLLSHWKDTASSKQRILFPFRTQMLHSPDTSTSLMTKLAPSSSRTYFSPAFWHSDRHLRTTALADSRQFRSSQCQLLAFQMLPCAAGVALASAACEGSVGVAWAAGACAAGSGTVDAGEA